jgi:hypothetical protein
LRGRRTPDSPPAEGMPAAGVEDDPKGDAEDGVDVGLAGVDARGDGGTNGCAVGVENAPALGV